LEDSKASLQRIRAVANYQFGADIGDALFPENVLITHSRRTGRIRHIYLDKVLLATLRPKDGLFSLTVEGASRLLATLAFPKLRVVVQGDVAKFILRGGDVFARHVVQTDTSLRAGEEVLVVSPEDKLLAAGKALLTGKEMLAFKRGVAVKVRRGVEAL
jgi:predicted RNA-binding protein (TIGR00451 family)